MSTAADIEKVAAETAFAGVVRIDRRDEIELLVAHGDADRRWGIANTPDTRFATASATKGLTALAVVTLIEDGTLDLTTTARSLLGSDLPLIDEAVTVEQLLAHRSGIGDYLDEDTDVDLNDYLMPVPVHRLVDTEDFVEVLDGFPTKFPPGAEFSYCNQGYVVLALIAERASGVPFHELIAQRVCGPAGMVDTEFLRSDELPGRTAVGYLNVDGHWRSNVMHLPVRGNGDGGIYTTVADVRAMWSALFGGRIVAMEWVAEMTSTAQPGAGGVDALRPRLLAPRDRRCRAARRWRHGRVVLDRPRPARRPDGHGDLQHLRWSVADGRSARRADPNLMTGGQSSAGADWSSCSSISIPATLKKSCSVTMPTS